MDQSVVKLNILYHSANKGTVPFFIIISINGSIHHRYSSKSKYENKIPSKFYS